MVSADINSTVRQRFADRFGPNRVRSNKYIWYGTNQLFHGLTLTFRVRDAEFSLPIPTNLIRARALSLLNAIVDMAQGGFEKINDVETRSYLEQVFKSDLQGHQICYRTI